MFCGGLSLWPIKKSQCLDGVGEFSFFHFGQISEVNEKIFSTTFYFINFQLLEFVGFLVDLNNFISTLFLVQAMSVVNKTGYIP